MAHDAGEVNFAARQHIHVFGDRGMAQRARDAETLQDQFPARPCAHLALCANNGVQTQQRQRGLRIVHRNAAVLNALDHLRRERVGVHFHTKRRCRERIQRRLDHFVHLQHVRPECLVAKSIVAESLLASGHHLRIQRHLWNLTDCIATAAIAATATAASKQCSCNTDRCRD